MKKSKKKKTEPKTKCCKRCYSKMKLSPRANGEYVYECPECLEWEDANEYNMYKN